MINFLILINFLFAINEQSFQVNFAGLPAAEVTLSSADTLYNNESVKWINFKTHSTGLIKYLFNVNNNYETITSSNLKNIISFTKYTKQPNIINNIKTLRIDQQTIYDNSSIIIPENHFNIFSLLYFISNNKILEPQKINIEREGIFYFAHIIPITIFEDNKVLYSLELMENHSAHNQKIIKKTDIFTWALFKNNAKREILVDYNKHNIISCVFKTRGVTMRAQNKKYN